MDINTKINLQDKKYRHTSMDLLYRLEIGTLTQQEYITEMKKLSYEYNKEFALICKFKNTWEEKE
ncbi:hypothetical protein [Ruoffia tabacinasalis]|uniref:Uncharacterized protein n=1 Tax=Ruoffia tabacinasalis TaxID=87458 RepID=A0ABS0LII3_9LACT|nr:hypothetical protein [Ruoffia tabacinasalis]MBG9977249.1 hypothetical protein [Ruoffia tabacinasalis]